MVADSGTTSGVGRSPDPFEKIGEHFSKVFIPPDGADAESTELAQVEHQLREPARDMHVTTGITSASLASTGKYADAGYASLFLDDRLEVFDLQNTKITVSREAVLRGHRCKDGLYRIPRRAADANKLETLPDMSEITQANYNQETMLITIPGLAKPKKTTQSVYELLTQRRSRGFPGQSYLDQGNFQQPVFFVARLNSRCSREAFS